MENNQKPQNPKTPKPREVVILRKSNLELNKRLIGKQAKMAQTAGVPGSSDAARKDWRKFVTVDPPASLSF